MHRFFPLFLVAVVSTNTSQAQVAPTPAAVKEFAERFFEKALPENEIPGAALVVVSDTGVVYMGGFGYADAEGQHAVDPVKTQFQIASVTKLFTSTLVMQQVAEGLLSLDRDVNEYLSTWQIPTRFSAPITLRHLLTHTAGLDELNLGYTARTAQDVIPLPEYLASSMPNRGNAPGDVISYSNHGMALAGLIAASATGQSYEQAIVDQVLRPLGMSATGFARPTHAGEILISGYTGTADGLIPAPFLFRNAPPAGALTSTASDMGLFLRFFLSKDSSAFDRQQMLSRQAGEAAELPGHALGWMVDDWRGQRVLHHAGGIPGYSSLAAVIPKANIGFFLVANRAGFKVTRQFVDDFGTQFFPRDSTHSPDGCQTTQTCPELEPYAGPYRSTRRARSGPENLWGVFKGSLRVYQTERGLMMPNGQEYAPLSATLFAEIGGADHLAFRLNKDGAPTHLFFGENLGFGVPVTYERIPFFAGGSFVNEFFLSWLLMILITPIVWPVGWLIRRLRKLPSRSGKPAQVMALLFGASTVYFAFAFIQPGVAAFWAGGGELIFGMPADLTRIGRLPLLQVALFIPMLIGAVVSVRRRWWGVGSTIHYLLVVVGSAMWLGFLGYFGLI